MVRRDAKGTFIGVEEKCASVLYRDFSDIDAIDVVNDARIARRIWRSAYGRVQVMCPASLCGTMTAGPDVVRGSGPNQSHGLFAHDPQAGCPNRRLDRFASRHHHPRNSMSRCAIAKLLQAAAASAGARKYPPLAMIAQAMRAILLATATATSLAGFLASSFIIQGRLCGCADAAGRVEQRPLHR
jgi:hypothetical protein